MEQFDTLHSDLLMQQVVAAVVQQQQQEEQEAQQQDQQELVVVGRGGGGVEVEEDVGELGVRGEINPALIEVHLRLLCLEHVHTCTSHFSVCCVYRMSFKRSM